MELKYGNSYYKLDLEKIGKYKVLSKESLKVEDEKTIIKRALRNPYGCKKLREIVKKGDSACIIVSDITRAYQKSSLWIPYLIEELNSGGLGDEDIVFLAANGAHRKQTKKEHDLILGEKLSKRFRIIDHDCKDNGNLVNLGTTSQGTPIEINKLAVECDHLIITGAVGFHGMAGYGGGRKSILPGISSHEAIKMNHLKVFDEREGSGKNPYCKMGNVQDNPMHIDMMEACSKINISFAFNVVLDESGLIYEAMAGNYEMVHEKGRKYCDEVGAIQLNAKADVVIASAGGYPKDMNLYQVSKVMEAGVEALKSSGKLIVLAECREDMSSEESVGIIMNFESNLDREAFLREEFVPEAYSGYVLCELAEKYEIILVSEYKEVEEVKKSGIRLVRRLDEAMDYVYANKAYELTYIIENGNSILPKIQI